MKPYLILILLLFCSQINAQNEVFLYDIEQRYPKNLIVIDQRDLRVVYRYNFTFDTIDKTPLHDMYALDIGKKLSRFYSLYAERCDSILPLLDMAYSDFPCLEGDETATWEDFYTSYPEKGTNMVQLMLIQREYYYEEPTPQQQWEITENVKEILGYKCFEANCEFRGRKWKVWFTLDIPMSYGPWKLGGLPGLILKAEDSTGLFSFEAKGIETTPASIYAYKIEKSRIQKATREKVCKLLQMRWKDPIGLDNASGIKTYYYGQDGKPIESVVDRYIPELELE